MNRLAGRVCVVNGAGSVIGRAVAGRFASEGGVVVGVDQVEHSVGRLAVQADLADEAQVEAMYEQVVREYGRLDVIYNNMGLMDPGDRSALDTSLQTWRRAVRHAGGSGGHDRVPGQRRFGLHHRRSAAARRRHHQSVHRPRVTAMAAVSVRRR